MLVIGQVIRSTAMAQAGTNFNHTVQMQKNYGHELVTDGMYAWLRHPSYFGFFWWGLGTQVVLGNVVCFMGYAVVLWGFFRSRITSEFFFPGQVQAIVGITRVFVGERANIWLRGRGVAYQVLCGGICGLPGEDEGWDTLYSMTLWLL